MNSCHCTERQYIIDYFLQYKRWNIVRNNQLYI